MNLLLEMAEEHEAEAKRLDPAAVEVHAVVRCPEGHDLWGGRPENIPTTPIACRRRRCAADMDAADWPEAVAAARRNAEERRAGCVANHTKLHAEHVTKAAAIRAVIAERDEALAKLAHLEAEEARACHHWPCPCSRPHHIAQEGAT